jgi:rubredoxin-NAD+ reductase
MEGTAMQPIVVIGAGLAGWTTVREFRKLDTTTPVVLVTADSGDFYAKPSLSNAYAQQRSPTQLVSTPAAKMAQTQGVELLAHTRVQALDLAAKTLHLQQGDAQRVQPYSQLVLATGALPIRLPLQGNAADQVLSINSLDDFSKLHLALGPRKESADSSVFDSKNVLIMGAGLIGCEFANDLLLGGHRIRVVDPSSGPLAALLPAGAGAQLRDALAALGLQWHFGTTVQSVSHAAMGALRVGLSDGSSVTADVVISAIGLRADTTLAAAAGLQCERGVLVDAQLQTSSPGVYALGDCAQYGSAGQRTLPYVMPIMHAAKVLATQLAGGSSALAFPLMPVAIKTPALPIVVSSPPPGLPGSWIPQPPVDLPDAAQVAGAWQFVDPQGVQRGFVLTGKHTARRLEQIQATTP